MPYLKIRCGYPNVSAPCSRHPGAMRLPKQYYLASEAPGERGVFTHLAGFLRVVLPNCHPGMDNTINALENCDTRFYSRAVGTNSQAGRACQPLTRGATRRRRK